MQFQQLVVDQTTSTNQSLKELAPELADYSSLRARYQGGGRGRLGRTWQAAPGSSLLLSVLTRPKTPALATLLAGLAVAEALEEAVKDAPQNRERPLRVALKWPNDLLVDGLKIGGILAELLDARVVVGVGINLTQTPQDLAVFRGTSVAALPSPQEPQLAPFAPELWTGVETALADMIVLVGVGEVGPWGSARTRQAAELGIRADGNADLTPAAVKELAWLTGLINWQDSPQAGWFDAEGNAVAEGDIFERYRDQVAENAGVREFVSDPGIDSPTTPESAAVFLPEDLTFTVADEAVARSYDGATVTPVGGEWEVTLPAGAQVRLPRQAELTRRVGGQFPTGASAARWGLSPALMESMDRIAAWNLVSAVDAFTSSGFSPSELLQNLHPAEVASTQGTGFGGMTSMRKLFVDRYEGEDYPQDILQETLPNVVAAHTMQNYIGGYGPMIQPVSACATAAVSLEEGADKIATGKASFVVAGAIDDISTESVVGFGSMNATAETDAMRGKGIQDRFFSRANDRRRGGFVESQGGGTALLTRGDIAADLGLPVLAVIGFVQSYSDGIHTSIPAPGLGALAAGRGGEQSRLARSLRALGVEADDIAVLSKHDTSTNANDPNESELHTRLARALGREEGNPLYVVSQKSVTGHAKGGAALFQVAGLAQAFVDGQVPGNRSLDCVDDALEDNPHLVWLRDPMEMAPPKAALATSLGFGHVSSVIAAVHPGAFEAALVREEGDEGRQAWRERATERLRSGAHRFEEGMIGRAPLFEQAPNRRLPEEEAREAEATMLLDPDARLQATGTY